VVVVEHSHDEVDVIYQELTRLAVGTGFGRTSVALSVKAERKVWWTMATSRTLIGADVGMGGSPRLLDTEAAVS
jgi:hypothetical protein